MLIDFFFALRKARLPVTIPEYLSLMEAIKDGVIGPSVDEFYHLARMTLVKNEAHFDKFDRVFGLYFNGVTEALDLTRELPAEWLRKHFERELSPEEKAKIEALGGWDKLMDRLKELLEEQKERHEGGNKWIGTGGTSPFGAYGYNPEGIRIGQDRSRHRRAVKVWDKREFKDYDDTIRAADAKLGIQVAV